MTPGASANLRRLSNLLRRERRFTFLKKLDAEIYLVGGAVRDACLGRETKDFDFVVRDVPAKTLEARLKKLGRVNLVGKAFGVFKFVPRKVALVEPFDIALPRTEHSLRIGGYRDFKIQSDPRLPIERDLLRRDLTVNALAWDVRSRRLVDPSGGLVDLKRKHVRAVGVPSKRFGEDYSRMLRAIRFACQLGFEIESNTSSAIRSGMKQINRKRAGALIVPRETVARELIKAFVAEPVRAFDFFHQSGATHELMPELETMRGCPQPKNWHTEGDVWKHTRLALSKLGDRTYVKWFGRQRPSAMVVLGTLFHDIGKPATLKTPQEHGTDRIRFNDHDKVGATMARVIAERLKLSVFSKSDALHHVDPDHLAWIVRYHLAGFRNEIDVMRETTLEKYFLNPVMPSEALLRVQYADTAGTIHAGGKADFSSLKKILARVGKLKRLRGRARRIKPLLNGNDVMAILKLKPGPAVGEALEKLREAQLSGRVKTVEEAKRLLLKRA